eukprot:963922-Rhodomonas_salina.3
MKGTTTDSIAREVGCYCRQHRTIGTRGRGLLPAHPAHPPHRGLNSAPPANHLAAPDASSVPGVPNPLQIHLYASSVLGMP